MPDKEKRDNQERVVPTGSQPQNNSAQAKTGKTGDNKSQSDNQQGDNSASSQNEGSQGTEGGEQQASTQQQQQDQGTEKENSTEDLLKRMEKSQDEIRQRLDSFTKQDETANQDQQVPDHDSQLSELDSLLEKGEITVDQYQKQSREIQEKKSQEQARNEVEKRLQEEKMEKASDQFLQENPDYPQYHKSEEMQRLMNQNPLFDEVSAYERLKRQEADSERQRLQQELDELKKTQENAVKNGERVTDSVGKEPGSSLQHGEVEEDQNLSSKEGMRAALRRTRGNA